MCVCVTDFVFRSLFLLFWLRLKETNVRCEHETRRKIRDFSFESNVEAKQMVSAVYSFLLLRPHRQNREKIMQGKVVRLKKVVLLYLSLLKRRLNITDKQSSVSMQHLIEEINKWCVYHLPNFLDCFEFAHSKNPGVFISVSLKWTLCRKRFHKWLQLSGKSIRIFHSVRWKILAVFSQLMIAFTWFPDFHCF